MSIQIELPDDNKAYGYTYQSALKPGYPYQFTGNYKDGITLNGVFQAEGWHTAVDVEFGISETIPDNPEEEEPDTGKDEEPDPISPTGTDSYQVTELPEEEDVWRDFYVWGHEKPFLRLNMKPLSSRPNNGKYWQQKERHS